MCASRGLVVRLAAARQVVQEDHRVGVARSRSSCAPCRCARPRRPPRRRVAGRRCRPRAAARPRSGSSRCTLSRVVPGIGVTMASSAPASALSSELLPTLGWPASTTWMPSRSSAPWRARSSTASTAARDARPAGRAHRPARGSRSPRRGSRAWPRPACAARRAASRRASTSRENAPASERPAERAAASVLASIRSATASACARSSLSLRKARCVNSPGSARRKPTARAGFEAARQQQLQHHRPAVRLQLQHVFAGVGVRRRKVDREALVDRARRRRRGTAGRWHGAAPASRPHSDAAISARARSRPERPDDADGAAARARSRSRRSGHRGAAASADCRLGCRAEAGVTLFPSTPSFLLMNHCCAIDRMLFVSQ